MKESYVERPPMPHLSPVVRTVWIQTTGETPYLQRHVPTGGVELHWPIGREPRLLGPLTGAVVEVIPAHTTLIGVRFWPGRNPLVPMALDELLDGHIDVRDLGHGWVERIGEAMARAATPDAACMVLQAHMLHMFRAGAMSDVLVGKAVQLLMPWHQIKVETLAVHLGLSGSQLRRRFLHAVGMSPKALQRTLRFQGFLALAQANETSSVRCVGGGMAALAAEAGYADQPHLTRECSRLTGLTPRALLGGDVARCLCGHEHAASYRPFLASRGGGDAPLKDARGIRNSVRSAPETWSPA
jgi:AraC-like DNA-binding protein